MKRHYIKKYIFTLIFMLCLFGYAGINFVCEMPILCETLKEFDWKHIDTEVTKIENVINDNVYRKYAWIETFGAVQEVIATDVDNGFTYVKSTSGALNYASKDSSSVFLQENIDAIQKLNEMAISYGATPIVFLAPDVYIEGMDEFREGIPYSDKNKELDIVRRAVEENEVTCIDARDYLEKITEWTKEPIFFNTDHHWKIKPAFYMAGVLMDELEKTWSSTLNKDGLYSSIESYNTYTYEECFLGSLGRETGIVYSGLDDFDLIYPKFETDFIRTYISTEGSEPKTVEGEFVKSILNLYNLNSRENIYLSDMYSTYLNSVNLQDYVTNTLCEDGPRVLIVRDSYMAPTAAFLANICSQLDMVWSIRYFDDIENLLRERDYDYVIVQIGSINLNNMDLLRCVK